MKILQRCVGLTLLGLGIGLPLAMLPASAAGAWPERTIRLIVPAAPGGGNDLIARLVAEGIRKELNQTAVIENRPGAGGMIGMRAVAQAQPDGYTFVVSSSGPTVVLPHTEKNIGYDSIKDFEAVAMLMRASVNLVVRNEVPARTVAELVALIRKDPKAIAFASAGEGQSPHMAAQLLQKMVGVDFLIVPYKGAGPAVTGILSGDVQAMFDSTTTLPHIKEGRLRALAIGSPVRSQLVPHLPTMVEAGFAGFEISAWYILLAPARTPSAIVDPLNQVVRKTLNTPEARETLTNANAEVIAGTPAEARNYVNAELGRWGTIIGRINAKAPAR